MSGRTDVRMPHRARGLVDLGVQSSRPLQIARSSCGDWTDTPADEAQTQHRQRKSTRPPRLNHRNAMAAQNMANGTCVPDKNDLRKKMDPPRNRGPEKFSSVAYGGSCVCTHEVTYTTARERAHLHVPDEHSIKTLPCPLRQLCGRRPKML